MEKQELKEEV